MSIRYPIIRCYSWSRSRSNVLARWWRWWRWATRWLPFQIIIRLFFLWDDFCRYTCFAFNQCYYWSCKHWTVIYPKVFLIYKSTLKKYGSKMTNDEQKTRCYRECMIWKEILNEQNQKYHFWACYYYNHAINLFQY